MFVIEKQEAYFLNLKNQRLKFYKELLEYKNKLNGILNDNANIVYNSIIYYLNKPKLQLA